MISCEATVVRSGNSSLVGISGMVVLSTRNTVLIDGGGSVRVVPKDGTVFSIAGQEVMLACRRLEET